MAWDNHPIQAASQFREFFVSPIPIIAIDIQARQEKK